MPCRLIALLVLLFAAAAPALAQESDWHRTDQTSARLIAATAGTGQADRLRVGLEFHMKPGWKIYWRSPGDAGIPPQPDWTGSSNLKSAAVLWPAPERFSVLGLETLGYKKEVVLPIDLAPAEPGKAVDLTVRVPYLTCDDICIPYTADLKLTLPAGPAAPTDYAHLISRYAAQVPGDGARHGLTLAPQAALAAVDAKKGTAMLRFTATSQTPFDKPDIYIEGPSVLAWGQPQVTLSDGGRQARFDVSVSGVIDLKGGGEALAKAALTATLVDGPRSAEAKVDVAQGTAPATQVQGSLLTFVLLAVLGGLILNLMPCVLPVLSIKVLGAIGHGGGEARDVRLGFLASSAGILAAFMVLAGGLVALKSAGMAIGWGIQFQQPLFLAAMAVIVAVFACNLFGFFEIHLPEAIGDIGVRTAHHTGPLGHFLQGALATLLATPCSAPFLGTAVGFALARGPLEIFAIFAGLALGLALPYLAVALFPALATNLPKPGPWMNRLRQIMGLALAATAAWLVWVVAGILGWMGAGVLAAGLVVLALVIYLMGHGRGRLSPALPVVLGLSVVAAAGLTPAPGAAPPDTKAEATALKAFWKPFDEAAIPGLVASGRTVLVDVTADWCITCQVNKRLVLNQGAVRKAIEDGKVTAMIADWTRPDPKIAAYLAKFGRYGIPFNAVYGPAAPNGIPLPELLTEGAVTEAIAKAGGVAIARKE